MSKTDGHIPGVSHVKMCQNSKSEILKFFHKLLQNFFGDDVLSKNNGKHKTRSTQHSNSYIKLD